MTDNIETMRGVIADALSNPAGTCANSCEGNGRGEIGGFHGGAAPGYVTEPRPDCAGAQHERQEASDEGQGHNQEIRS